MYVGYTVKWKNDEGERHGNVKAGEIFEMNMEATTVDLKIMLWIFNINITSLLICTEMKRQESDKNAS
jgi:hypothetical protein